MVNVLYCSSHGDGGRCYGLMLSRCAYGRLTALIWQNNN